MPISSPLQAAWHALDYLSRKKLFCPKSWSSGIWKKVQLSVAGEKWQYWELDLPPTHLTKDFKTFTSSRTAKLSCECCVCHLEMRIRANTGKLVYRWCSPFKVAGAKCMRMTHLHSRGSFIKGKIINLFFVWHFDLVLYLHPDLQRASLALTPHRYVDMRIYIIEIAVFGRDS